jgi:hypothetical protein
MMLPCLDTATGAVRIYERRLDKHARPIVAVVTAEEIGRRMAVAEAQRCGYFPSPFGPEDYPLA